jgi:hypothetical protein
MLDTHADTSVPGLPHSSGLISAVSIAETEYCLMHTGVLLRQASLFHILHCECRCHTGPAALLRYLGRARPTILDVGNSIQHI